MNYTDFASKISFFEFIQNEYKIPHFKIENYKEEFSLLKESINIDRLTKILENNPKIIDIFEEFFQLSRFTNTQYIHFCFDISILNNSNDETIINYAEKSLLKFENEKVNEIFCNIFNEIEHHNNVEKIFNIKRTITRYIDKLISKKEILYNHISNSVGSRLRIARYLIENLKADEYLKNINFESYLQLKRQPIDTKSIHGKFGSVKIKNIFDSFNIDNINHLVNDKIIDNNLTIPEKYNNNFCYVKEKALKDILKRKDGRDKHKVFDFILIYNKQPVLLIETNFYSTSGTKIGINQGEYVDLIEDIQNYSKQNKLNYKFSWITDGNYWLLKYAESRFNNLKSNYFKNDYELLNYNLFRDFLPDIMKQIQSEG
ncbi:MAG: type II restriction endonuclease [Deltaproteobacteria bacterium]|nr:type II restriction endonuclease [Deltaproteobacteria bacterium]MCL5892646.1 type II restriction endonuclease [Deltaproteobacteria bacterium]